MTDSSNSNIFGSPGSQLMENVEPGVFQETPSMSPPPVNTQQAPGVWIAFVLYCVVMAALYMLCTVGGALLALNAEQLALADTTLRADQRDIAIQTWTAMGWVMCVISFGMGALYAIGPFSRPGKSGWILGIVLICFGLTSVCTLPFSIFMLIKWFQPPLKEYYGIARVDPAMQYEPSWQHQPVV